MKRALGFGVIVTLLVFALSGIGLAEVQTQNSGTNLGQAKKINFSTGLVATNSGSTTTVVTSGTQAITGGTINGAVIGGSTPAAATVTALTATGNVGLGDAVTDITTLTGKIAGATPLTFDGATADTIYTILAVDDPASSSKTVTLPAVTGTVKLTGAAVALTPGAAVSLTVAKGTTLYTDTTNDNEDQTITFSGAGSAGDEVTILFTTSGTSDEVITFHSTLCHSTGTLTLGTTADRYYSIRFVSDGSKWFEVSRTAEQS